MNLSDSILDGISKSMTMANFAAYSGMWINAIDLFKQDIQQGPADIVDYSETLTLRSGMFTSLDKIQTLSRNENKTSYIFRI